MGEDRGLDEWMGMWVGWVGGSVGGWSGVEWSGVGVGVREWVVGSKEQRNHVEKKETIGKGAVKTL